MSSLQTYSILVVDDDPFVAGTIAMQLRNTCPHGTNISIAHRLTDAMAMLSKERFQAVIVDYELPDGHGTDLIRSLLRTPGKPVAIFLVSGMDPDQIDVAGLLKEHPSVTFIEKPFRFKEVMKKVLEAIQPPTTPEQSFYGLKLFELIQAFALTRKSMTLRVLMPNGRMGMAAIRDGELIHAALDGVEGKDALRNMARERKGHIRLEEGCYTAKTTIFEPTQKTLIDIYRDLDEQNLASGIIPPEPRNAVTPRPRRVDTPSSPGTRPSANGPESTSSANRQLEYLKPLQPDTEIDGLFNQMFKKPDSE